MKKLLKTALSLLALTGTFYVGGCTPEEKPDEPLPPVVVFDGVTSIRAEEHIIPLFEGDTYEPHVEALPRGLGATLKYRTGNSSIASVDENGKITGVSAGTTELIIENNDGSVTKTIPVEISKAGLSSTKRAGVINGIKKEQNKAGFKDIDTVRIFENSTETRSLNGKQMTYYNSDQEMVISKSNAFFAITGLDKEIKCEDGAMSLRNWGWILYTNEYFDTYVYHIDGYTKTYCVVSTTSFIEKEGGRYAALQGVLDNLFTSGHEIMDSYVSYSIGADILSAGNTTGTIKAASNGDGNFTFTYGESGTYTVSPSQESDYKIPAGTPYNETFLVKMFYNESIAQYREMVFTSTYALDSDEIVDVNTRKLAFDHKITAPEYPNKDEYTKVESFMDL